MAADRVHIIAEIASAHEGDPSLALRLFDAAAATGADSVKFQIFDRDSLIARCHPKYDAFGIIDLGREHWAAVLRECRSAATAVMVEVYDLPSLELAEASEAVSLYKVPTSDIANRELIARVAATAKPFFLAVGGATDAEIAQAVGWVSEMPGVAPRARLMHGFQSYPTRLPDTNLARIRRLKTEFGWPVGYADHVDAEDREAALAVPLMALAAGATTLEKHVTPDRSARGRDHYSALNPDEFAEFVTAVRTYENAIGTAEPALNEAEQKYREDMKKYAVAGADLAAGHRLTSDDVVFRRTGRDGIGQDRADELMGRSVARKIAAGEPLRSSDLDA